MRKGWKPYVMAVTLVGALLGAVRADAISLTNSPVSEADLSGLFDWSGRFEDSNVFDYDPTTPGGDGRVWSGWATGKAGTEAEGLYLYLYKIEFFTTADPASTRLTGISNIFEGLVRDIDLNGGGVDTSYYVASIPGNYPNGGASLVGSVITFSFTCCNKIDPGETSTYFGAISVFAPKLVSATLYTLGGATTTTQVYAPVPEPSTLFLMTTGIGTILLAGRSKRRR